MEEYTWYYNGEWLPRSEVKIDPGDRGFELGDTVFEGIRTYGGKGFRIKEHMDRFYRSLNYVRMDPGLSPEEMQEVIEEAIRRNEPLRNEVGDLSVRPFVTRGPGRNTRTAGPPNVFVRVVSLDFGRFARFYETGAHGVIPRTRSYSAESLDPKVKHYSRMNFALAELEVGDVDPDAWPILIDTDGNLTEGTGSNVFLVTNGVIRTVGDHGILQGVSRGMVFDLARQLDIPIMEEDLQPYDLYTADEAFFSGTSIAVLPVTRVDNRQLGDGKPGPIVNRLLAAWSETVGIDIVDQALRFDRG